MGADICSLNLFDFDELENEDEQKKIQKQDKLKKEELPETIPENISIYSNPDITEKNDRSINNKKYYRNYDEINNLRSSIFDNEENDHVKKYEQEINAEEHQYIFSSNYNLNKTGSNKGNYINNYTFKNSKSGGNKISKENTDKNMNYEKSNEFILNNRSSFKNLEVLRSKKNFNNNEEFISFGNNETRKTNEIKAQNEINDINNINKENINNNKNIIIIKKSEDKKDNIFNFDNIKLNENNNNNGNEKEKIIEKEKQNLNNQKEDDEEIDYMKIK